MGDDVANGSDMDSDEETSQAEETVASRQPAVATLEVPFNSRREAEVVRNSLQVDPEPKRSGSSKTFTIKENVLCVEIRSPDVRQLRTALSSFMDLLHLVSKTIDQFGPPAQQSKKMCV
ncbi:EKC/KEOPS complex subunit LAGE3 [Panulirus ornatus]|uniref:EKC/KEOPS complex subunit LAGE3 n=1 Tax=Panulirus ornatus TaxID=150431 RepID=UPI003A8B583A